MIRRMMRRLRRLIHLDSLVNGMMWQPEDTGLDVEFLNYYQWNEAGKALQNLSQAQVLGGI